MRTILLDAPSGPSLTTTVRAAIGDDFRHLLDFEAIQAAIDANEVDLLIDARTDGPDFRLEHSMPVVVCVRDEPDQVARGGFYAPRDPDAVRAVTKIAATLARKQKRDLAGLSTPQRITHWLLDAAPIAIGVRQVKGDDFVHVLDNRLSAAMWGKTPDELQGRTDRELGVSQSHIDRVLAAYERARRENRAVDFEFDFAELETPRLLRGKLAPMSLEGSKSEYMAFVAENVTEMRQLKAQLLRADRLASLGSMAASIGHEIKNPASIVLLNLTNALDLVAEEREQLSEDTRDEMEASLHAAMKAVRQISVLVNDLQSLASASEEGHRPVKLRAVVDSVLALVGAELRARATVRHEYEDGPAVTGNAVKLAQVVLAMLRHAHERMDAADAPRNTVTVRTRGEDGHVIVEVSDNGTTPENPFGDAASTGNAFGLATAESLITEYGGTVGWQSEEGLTRVWFRLPASS